MENSFKFICTVFFSLCVLFLQTHIAFAQGAFVPVEDIRLNPAFADYVTDFHNTFGAETPNGTTDSLRDLISGSNPGNGDPRSIAGAPCKAGDNLPQFTDHNVRTQNPAFAYSDSKWMEAHLAPDSSIPDAVPPGAGPGHGPYVQVNTSTSLRCLLQEVVEWQKLGLSVQIHALLKTYIADAQTAQLNKQLMNKITAANVTFSKIGNVVNDAAGGGRTERAIYNVNIAENEYNTNLRQLEEATDEAVNDPNSDSLQGSWGLCEPWRLDATADMVRNNRTTTEDPFKYPQEQTECQLNGTDTIDPTNWTQYSDNFNTPTDAGGSNGAATFLDGLLHPQDTPLGASSLATAEAEKRIANQQRITDKKEANSGYIPTTQYNPDNTQADPHNLDMQYGEDVNPAGLNQDNVNSLVRGENEQVANSTSLDSQASLESEQFATAVNTNTGVYGADVVPIQTAKTAVDQLVQEFYDAIEYGYFGVQQDTTEWGQATMLSIYDEMKFDSKQPLTEVTNNRDTVNTGY